jgi:hypothetical protein
MTARTFTIGMNPNAKTFPVVGLNGEKIDVEQLGTFAFYIKNIQFRFVVTRATDGFGAVVTHRATGMKVCNVDSGISYQPAYLPTQVELAKMALERLIDRVGADRVYQVITDKEKELKA